MISIKEVGEIHKILIDLFGGSDGIRDLSALESSLSRPFQTFDEKNLHPTPIHKAAALVESIVINHPFVDGNKRTGYVVMRSFLIANGLDIKATQNEKYDFCNKYCFRKYKIGRNY
jgi:death-on-curing protein